MWPRLFEALTGRAWTTTRSMAAEFGPTLASRYPELADYPDAELIRRPVGEVLAEIRARRVRLARVDAPAAGGRVWEVTRQ